MIWGKCAPTLHAFACTLAFHTHIHIQSHSHIHAQNIENFDFLKNNWGY